MAFDFVSFYQNIILNKIVTAIIIFFLGFIIGKIAGNIAKKLLAEIELNKKTVNTFFGRINTEKFISSIVTYTIYIATVIIALNKLGIANYLFYGAVLFFLLLIISSMILELYDLLPNLYAWMIIKRKNYFKINDRIKMPLAEGIVRKITPLNTRVITEHGDELYIRNRNILENLSVKKQR